VDTIELERRPWGHSGDEPVELISLDNGSLRLRLTTLGARLVGLECADRGGVFGDVLLGYDDAASYAVDSFYLGAVCGRFCNRIAKGRFTLNGREYQVPVNNGPNALHGGPQGFDTRMWAARLLEDGVALSLVSADGDMGFPGELRATVSYRLQGASLLIEFSAETTADTVVALTSHAYFNLTGDPRRSVLDHELRSPAFAYTPTDATSIPTGEVRSVEGTPFDFRSGAFLGARMEADDEQLNLARGYDHNLVLAMENSAELRLAASVYEPLSGRTLTVHTTEPGMQLYTGNFLDGVTVGKGGVVLGQHTGFCLETQHFPDSPNQSAFPSVVLKAGETLRSETRMSFGVR
jgi:aldose 1-epimerase